MLFVIFYVYVNDLYQHNFGPFLFGFFFLNYFLLKLLFLLFTTSNVFEMGGIYSDWETEKKYFLKRDHIDHDFIF